MSRAKVEIELPVRVLPVRSGDYRIEDADGIVFAKCWHRDVADRIALAVNEIDGLREVLRDLVAEIDDPIRRIENLVQTGGTVLSPAIKAKARAILARIDGGPRDV